MASGISAGTAYMDLLPNMSKFGPAATAGVQKSTAGIGTKLKSTFGTLGVALGATFAIGFVKSAFSDFQAAEKSVARFNVALEKSGNIAGINADSFNDWLADFALNVGKDDDAIRDLTTRLVTAFDFTKLPGDPQQTLQDITAAIIDMGAETGVAEGRLIRMFQSLLNDPATALSQLQKLGIVTEEESQRFADMAANGEGAAVSMELLARVSERYTGAAAKTATESEKMSAAFGEFKETMGGIIALILRPLVTLFTALFRFLADKPAVIYALAASFVALGIAMKATQVGAFFGRMKTGFLLLTGIPAKIGTLAASVGTKLIPALSGAAAGAAAFGAALVVAYTAVQAMKLAEVIGDIYEFNNAAEAADNRAAALSFALEAKLGGSAEELRARWRELKDEFEVDPFEFAAASMEALNRQVTAGDIGVDQYKEGVKALAVGLDSRLVPSVNAATLSEEALAGITADLANEVDNARGKYVRFARLTKKEFGEWAGSIVDNFTTAAGGLTSFNRVFTTTARQLERNADNIRRTLAQEKQDLDALLALGLDDEVVQRLMEEGPAAIHAFIGSSEEGRRNVVADIEDIIKNEKELENRIRGVDAGARLFARNAREDLAPALRDAGDEMHYLGNEALRTESILARMARMEGFDLPTTGGSNNTPSETGSHPPPPLAEGGIVRRPLVARVGEAGPEAVIPLSRLRTGGGEMTLRIVDWRNGIARLGDELDFDDRSRP